MQRILALLFLVGVGLCVVTVGAVVLALLTALLLIFLVLGIFSSGCRELASMTLGLIGAVILFALELLGLKTTVETVGCWCHQGRG
jgi:hypothetical protein